MASEFQFSEIRTAPIVESLSPERLQKYRLGSDCDDRAAIKLYEHNVALSEAFYPSLQCLEICLRNRLHNQFKAAFGEGWLQDHSAPLAHDARQDIAKAVTLLGNVPIEPGDIVAQLNFGFWVSLLGPRYDATLWRQAAYKALRNARSIRRKTIHNRMNALRRLRNRIAHHEPIFDRPLKQFHEEALEAIHWMCADTSAWARKQSRLAEVLEGSGQA